MSMLSKALSFVTGANPFTSPGRPTPGSTYMRGGRTVTMAGWKPALRDTQDDVSEAWDAALARTVDLIQNSGWIAGMVDQAVANTVGPGLRLFPRPENAVFGLSDADARAWGKMVASRWETFARAPQECDVQAIRSFGQLQGAAFRSYLATGEILAELPWRKRSWNRYGTKVRLLSPHRLSRKTDNVRRMVNGVMRDIDGMPIAYLATRKDPMMGTLEYIVPARDSMGRRRIIHCYDGLPETWRGISPLVPALQVARQFDQLSDATLQQTLLKAVFAATIVGEAPTQEVLEGLLTPQEQARMMASGQSPFETYLEMTGGYYDNSTINTSINGRIAHLFPGQELEFHTANSPGSEYAEFSRHLLREISRCFGLTYESATGDYNGATYSSVRMASGEMYAVTKVRRENILAPFCQAVYEAWLEEEIAEGGIAFPGGYAAFIANRVAASRAEWRGAPKPQADDLKTAKAHEIWQRLGVMSDDMIASDLGWDIEDVYAARAAEIELRKNYGLPDPMAMPATGGAPVGPGGQIGDQQDEERDE